MTDQILEFEIWFEEVTGRDALDIRPSWARGQTGQGLPLKVVVLWTLSPMLSRPDKDLSQEDPTISLRLDPAKNTSPSPLESGF
jgi:hypothetical protein